MTMISGKKRQRLMHDEMMVARFNKIGSGPQSTIIEAAYGHDVMWINIASVYDFKVDEQSKLRAYIRATYQANGTPIRGT